MVRSQGTRAEILGFEYEFVPFPLSVQSPQARNDTFPQRRAAQKKEGPECVPFAACICFLDVMVELSGRPEYL